MLQCCLRRAHLDLLSRDFDGDDNTEKHEQENTRPLPHYSWFDPNEEETVRLRGRTLRHRKGRDVEFCRRRRILNLQLDQVGVSQWSHRLLKEAHSLGALRIDRATLCL